MPDEAVRELIGAVGREYSKLGRLTLESEFGPYLRLAVRPGCYSQTVTRTVS